MYCEIEVNCSSLVLERKVHARFLSVSILPGGQAELRQWRDFLVSAHALNGECALAREGRCNQQAALLVRKLTRSRRHFKSELRSLPV
jgi:hypothetical protein